MKNFDYFYFLLKILNFNFSVQSLFLLVADETYFTT